VSEYTWDLPAAAAAALTSGLDTIDHKAAAEVRIVDQWRKPKIIALVRALVSGCQSVEEALQQLLLLRNIDDGEGSQLDVLGRIVGQARNGLSDADYRNYLRARIATNRSRGVVEDIIRIVRLLINNDPAATIRVESQGIATCVVKIEGITITSALADVIISFLRTNVSAGTRAGGGSAGVRFILEWAESAQANLFQYDDGPGYDQGNYAGSVD
jgi:hypothetical protein